MSLKVYAVKCCKCGTIVYSRARHDFRWCDCKAVAVDGGFDYLKICGEIADVEKIDLSINATKKQLFDDWNKHGDKYGRIPATVEIKKKRKPKRKP